MINYDRENKDLFTSKRENKVKHPTLIDEIEMHSLSGSKLLDLCDTFPKTAAALQEYAIQ